MPTYDIVEGTTAPIDFQLLESGAPIDLTFITPSLLLEDCTGTVVTSPGVVSVQDATLGKVRLVPTDTTVFDGTKGPYSARWKLIDGTGKISFVPTSIRDIWNIIGQ